MKRCPVCHAEYAGPEDVCPRDGSRLVEAPAGTARVQVTQPAGGTVEAALTGDELHIGTSSENELVLADPTVSRRHAVLVRRQGEWYIQDAGSRNGVFVNGRRVGPEGQRIGPDDAVQIGQSSLRLIVGPAPEAMPADRVIDGRYELEREIGRDATGILYRARRLPAGDLVTVRVSYPELANDPVALERFRRHARVAARIDHPNSVRVYDSGSLPDGRVYLVEEPLSGRTLRDLIRAERGMTLARVVGIFNQICGAVQAANLNGIVLRDIEPESIFVERGADGREVIKVGGYGLAKLDPSLSEGVTMAGVARASAAPQYMSPEQLQGRPLDSRSDVYSLGIILYELLTGSVPFDSPSHAEVVEMQLHAPAPDVSQLGRPDLDEGVAAVVSRALAKDPAKRQPTAVDLAEALRAVAGVPGKLAETFIISATGQLPLPPLVVPSGPAPVPAGEEALPSAVAPETPKGRGPFNPIVLALMAEAFLSRVSSGLLKTTVPLFALLVFGFDVSEVMLLVLAQNIVPLLLRPMFGTLADRHGKKKVFLFALVIRTAVGLLYAIANWPMFFLVNALRGVADSAKVPSGSAMIADSTDEQHVAQAYSWYTTIKSTSGGIGESVGAYLLVVLTVLLVGGQTVAPPVAVLEEDGSLVYLKSPDEVGPDMTLPGTGRHPEPRRVSRVDPHHEMALRDVPLKDWPKVIDPAPVRRALVYVFFLSAALSAASVLLVAVLIKERPAGGPGAEGARARSAEKPAAKRAPDARGQPNVWAFALLGTALTAPAYMVTGEFFTALAYELRITGGALGTIKLLAETLVPLVFGPVFGWLADRMGTKRVIAMRSTANLLTSLLFWVTWWFQGTALLGLMMGVARAVDEIGKAAFKPTWGAITARVSSFDLGNRSRTLGILEGGVDTSDLVFPQLSGVLLDRVGLGPLMGIRALLALAAEAYGHLLMRKYKV